MKAQSRGLARERQQGLLRDLAYFGLAGLGSVMALRPRRAILCYHRLRQDGPLRSDDDPALARALPVGLFTQHMTWLATFADIVTLDELVRSSSEKTATHRWTVVVTFDDGFADNLDLGLPVMRRHGIRPMIFLTTGFVSNHARTPWWLLFDRLAAVAPKDALRLIGVKESRDPRKEFATRMRAAGPESVARHEGRLTDALARQGHHWPSPFLSPEQVAAAAAAGEVEFGAHTVGHASLTACTDAELADEIVGSRDTIAAWTGLAPRWFAYPFGDPPNFDSRVASMVGQAGFIGAVTLIPKYVDRSSEALYLPRIAIRESDHLPALRARLLAAPMVGAGRGLVAAASASQQ